MLPDSEAWQCQRAFARLPDLARLVLTVLYVTQPVPVELQLRLLRVPPRLCRERQLRGLRMFWTLIRISKYAAE